MNKVIIVNLNGNAYQIDEAGYNALSDYINRADAQLQASDDKREVIGDLEQAIADKCAACLRPHKNLVTAAEIQQILNEIGPVQTADGQTVEIDPSKAQEPPRREAQAERPIPRRYLYRIREDSKWSGVCTGLAAYTDVDVNLVRVFVVLGTVFTGFFLGVIVYAIMTIFVPVAYSESEFAEAHSRPPELRRS